METQLTLKEKFLLLNYDPEKGRLVATGQFFAYELSGTCLLELAELERINIKDKRVVVLSSKHTGDKALDLILDLLARKEKPKRVSTWINKFSNYVVHRKVKRILLEGLIGKRILRKEEARALFIFKYDKYPARSTVARKALIKSLQELVLRNREADKDIYLIVALIGAIRGVNKFFTGKDRKIARKRIKEIMNDSEISKVVSETVTAVQGAIIASIAASTVATTTDGGS